MPLPIKDILSIIANNTIKHGCPIPISREAIYSWANKLNLAKDCETVLFTGLLYQLVPYLEAAVKYLESLEEGKLSGILLRIGRLAGKFIDLSKVISRVPRDSIQKQHEILYQITKLLLDNGFEFGYLFEEDMYSGALLYDLGLDKHFKMHAEKVYGKLKNFGVKKLITIDPHTTYIMRSVYKQYIPDYDIEVINYLELLVRLNIKPKRLLKDTVAIHDPCYYARYENIISEPRILLKNAGLNVLEPPIRARKLTFCCGGPVESISPRLASSVANLRVKELCSLCDNIVVMCPICYANLSRAVENSGLKINIFDISHYLYQAYSS